MDYDKIVGVKDLVEIFEGREDMEIDDYAIDMHCSKGRQMGKNRGDFVKSGSVVVGEDKEYLVGKWRSVYQGRQKSK